MYPSLLLLNRKQSWIWILILVLWSVDAQADSLVYRATTSKLYQDVMEDLSFAIGSNNFRQTSRNQIGGAIRERGFGGFSEVTIVHFCNLEYARKLLVVSSDYLIHMPCRIAVWESENSVFLEVKLVPDLGKADESALVDQINNTLIRIVDQAVERWSSKHGLK